ncbi:sigma-54-dependent Fis family transcriptional regulator [Burkholderia sp. LA-2-3-30-S1-D2]|uniref:sigma-54-dependent Fis family transcriptional regulator n=1 Tax=Burkholderia sp. LA-2-3-30-S1-D2 TaxID=1637862 RepID=UPI000753B3D3|nr:sigma-54-dependent Fis family transcriptional regulator [Burkholderia sp. LA-2-3-30-S1-D2]AOJ00146.1 Fis family transcriptional regulator [Burkholderia sp. LA-2-3-30-S1-D2]KVE13413.1 Fis family transcriptional regulator [Burkholderia sp. LA-2-3-30-S1-D2]
MRDDVHPTANARATHAPGWPTPTIQKSHERSETFGLQASARPDYDLLSGTALALKREQNRVLCVHAMPVMETLHEQIVNTQSMIVLTDAEGLILHSIGDDDFLRRAERVALRPGANWAESRQGTNAIGTALAELCPMVVHGDQHFLAANHFLTCSSVPILDPYGDAIGVLDVTGDHRSYHQHTMALAKMSVQMIENHLFTTTFQETLQVSFHGRPEFLGTLMEGIVAFTADGRFLSANRSAQFQLGMPLAALRAHTLASLFDVTSAQLIDRMRASTEPHVSLNLGNGAVVCARVQFRRALRAEGSRPAEVHDVAAPAARPPAAQCAASLSRLSYLDTGDPQVAAVIAKVRKVIGKDIPVLITGETGTGKELLAQAIHNDSPRRDGPFVAVNCASIPETLIESELFGYEEGAFTGARRKGATGKLLQANGGTLFLDEIGDMPYPLQVRLLRVLQERIVNPLGSTKAIGVDIAIICATHRDLRDMIAQNRFREDLYYRLNGLVVRLPPLRDRTDLAVVVQKMLQRETLSGPGRRPLSVAPGVMALFERCAWPGNFRQLANLLRTAAAMVDDDCEIRCEHLPDDFFDDVRHDNGPAAQEACTSPPLASEAPAFATAAGDARLQDVAASAIAAALARHGGNVSAAARALGVSRNTIYRKMPAAGPDALEPDEP